MKFALFAAAALFATPAFAQTSGNNPASPDPSAPAVQPGNTADTTTARPSTDSMPSQPPMASDNSAATGGMAPAGGTMTAGGYQPSTPMPMASGGQQPVFTPGPSVAQAYPAPAPLASYPICKKGQYDKCMQRGGR